MEIKPIARFRSPFPTKFGIPRQAGLASGLRGRIVFEPEFRSAEAVRGLEGFDYLWLIWEFSEAQVDEKVFKATVRPPRL
ncbi:MAG: SAM-dependent methyltransferase, partial [Bacteroidales bacterium]|nr:SAM-dependent methyltransferase [Bacteroidales bacterium]